MPNKPSAKKALRQSVSRTERNKVVKAEIKSLRVHLRKALTDKNMSKAGEIARDVSKKLDKAQARGILKKNTVARTKSRLMARLNAATKAEK